MTTYNFMNFLGPLLAVSPPLSAGHRYVLRSGFMTAT